METPKTFNPASFSIVVLGNMNPAIHHPYWYKSSGILSEDEAKLALDRPVICLPQVSQFSIPSIEILCQSLTWQVTASAITSTDRALDIATRAFANLTHTPISAFGMNFIYQPDVGVEDASIFLANAVSRIKLGLPPDGKSAQIIYSISNNNTRYNLSIAPSDFGPNLLRIAVNAHHDIVIEGGEYKEFDLGPLLSSALAYDRPFVEKLRDDIITAVTAVKEVR